MKAAVLKAFGSPLVVETVADPVLGTGEVIVYVAATRVLSYTGEVLSGTRQYLLEPPVIFGSGAIGRVRRVGPDSTRLVQGDWVYCDPTVRSRDDAITPDITLQGLSARGEGGLKLQRFFHDGAWAEQIRVPTENAVRIGEIAISEAPRWCAIGMFLVPYGGLLAANLRAGETVLINGATGGFGSAGVAVALGMGAGRVVATGRNVASLLDLRRRFGARVHTIQFSGDEANDRARMMEAAQGPIDCVLDLLPPEANPTWARAAIMAVRQNGRVALMGGIGMLGGGGLDLPYVWIMRNCITIHGQWMYPRIAITGMVGLIRSGLVSVDHDDVTTFSLDEVNAAVAHAAVNAGPFSRTVICP